MYSLGRKFVQGLLSILLLAPIVNTSSTTGLEERMQFIRVVYAKVEVKPKPSAPKAPQKGQAVKSVPAKTKKTVDNAGLVNRILATAQKYLGRPYSFGSSPGQTRTFDCSSYVQCVFGQNGIKLPREARQQATVGISVSKNKIQKGDLLFMSSNGRSIGHVAIYVGSGKIIHASTGGKKSGVVYGDFNNSWVQRHFVTAKHVVS